MKNKQMKNMKPEFASASKETAARFAWRITAMATLICAFCLFGSAARAQGTPPARATAIPAAGAQGNPAPPATIFVNTTGGGFILGYDIDQTGTEGILAESKTLAGGKDNAAVETFDQTTGKILRVVTKQNNTKNDFVCLGIYGASVGLVELERVKTLFVDQRIYSSLNPLNLNMLTGPWTPPLTTDEQIIGMADSQGSPTTAVLASQNFNSLLFSANVGANTFGPVITLTDGIFGFNNSPILAINTVTNKAILAGGTGAFGTHPTLGIVDLTTQSVSEFIGVGFGFVNGMAVDEADNIAVTTTEDDFSIEYYDLSNPLQGHVVVLKNATSQAQSGQYVKFDPIHKWFLIGQEFSSVAPTGSSILVYDTRGNFVEAVNNLSLPASPVNIAINPSKRMGYVLVTPALTQLQSFTY